MKIYLEEKRDEYIRAIGGQDYSLADIAEMFNINKTKVHRIIKATPDGWQTPWVKRTKKVSSSGLGMLCDICGTQYDEKLNMCSNEDCG